MFWLLTNSREPQAGSAVWIDKLTSGVLRILTPLGPRYVTPSRPQRILLLWMCRHFHTLPQQVLSGWQQDLIDTLCAEHKFVSAPHDNAFEAAPIVGTLERQTGAQVQQFSAHRAPFGLSDSVIA